MKKSRRKFEELAWVFGFHGLAVTLHRIMGNRGRRNSALTRFYSELLPPNALVFDVGANVGSYSEAMEGAGARVIAVEPNADCIRHIELTYADKRIETLHAAIGPDTGVATFNISDARDDMSTMSSEWIQMLEREYRQDRRQWRRATVPIVTLDSLVRHYGMPDYIKIDVEGYEASVLDGLSTQPRLMSFEYHGANLPGAMECLRKPIFAERSLFNLTNEQGTKFQLPQWVGRRDIESVLESVAGTLTYRDLYIRLV
jgi:FkbM family methyltransferase